jgi:diguanylate cyclase (GGDEF)-like protein
MYLLKKSTLRALFIGTIITILSGAVYAKQVLFISSYSESFDIVNPQKKGIHDIFDPAGITLDIEYMDMKQYNTEENGALFYNHLRYKIAHHSRYDAVITGDDAALHFAETYQHQLFPAVPIVFLCINDIEYAKHFEQNPLITGAVENFYLKDTIAIATRFQPRARQIVGIYDNALSGQGDRKQFAEVQQYFPGYEFSGINASECSRNELKLKLAALPENCIVLYLSCFEDNSGNQYTIADSVALITSNCKAPVYRTGVGGLGSGIIGGKVVSYEASGQKAASMVLSILRGIPVSAVPIVTEGESQYRFDYAVLKKYNIKRSLVPDDAVLINTKPLFPEQYKTLLLPVTAILAIIILILLGIVYDNMRRLRFSRYVRYQAEHDYLTNLPNRRAAIEELNIIRKRGYSVTVMLMDIDNFKSINDTDGHACGDAILVEIARRFIDLMRTNDFSASRFGGDEFLIITGHTHPDDVRDLVDKIRQLFARPLFFNGKPHYIKCCIGIASSDNNATKTSELITNADLAMYAAKKAGKNNFAYFDSTMKADLLRNTEIEASLSSACQNDGFAVVYQPQIDLSNGQTHCYEALVRLKDRQFYPDQFIPVAEETDMIHTIGRIVTRKVIEQMDKWRTDGIPMHPVSINYSSKQIRDTGYVQYLKNLLDHYHISPDLIEIEITENVFLGNTERATQLFTELSAIGVNLTLDDFGTGYSSIHYLTYIPVTKIKLDKSLIDIYLQTGKDDFVHNIIRLSHSLGLKITVEGIEEKKQYERLKDFSCDYIQGFYFSKPITGDEIETSPFR